jgi:hypothetical protein
VASRGARQRGHLRDVLVGEHRTIGDGAPLDDPALAIDQPGVGVGLARHDGRSQPGHRRDDRDPGTPRNRIRAEGDARRARVDHALHEDRRRMRKG